MVEVASQIDLPIKLLCPHLNYEPIPNACGGLGLGDIVIPGLVVSFCYIVDKRSATSKQYYRVSMLSYVLSLACCGAVLVAFETP